MKNSMVWVFLAVAAISMGACGSGNGTTGAPGATPGQQPQNGGGGHSADACAGAWTTYVNSNPVGRTLVYSMSTHMTMGGHDTVVSSDTETDSVTESSDDHVTTTITTRHGSHTFKFAKSDFTGICGNGGHTQAPASGTVLAQDQQPIDVAAGHFDCNHFKYQMNGVGGAGGSSVSETWTDEQGGFLVKSVTTLNTAQAGAVSTTIKELTQKS